MTVAFELPKDVEASLRQEFGDLGQAAKEALIIEAYRTARLSIGQVARILGYETRHEAEQWLGSRGVTWNYGPDDLAQDRETLDRLYGESH